MDLHHAIPYVVVAAASIALFIDSFSSKYKSTSGWMVRVALFLLGPVGVAWSALGFYLLSHSIHQHTDLSWPRFWVLDHLHYNIAGVYLGFLITLLINPEFYRRRRRANAGT